MPLPRWYVPNKPPTRLSDSVRTSLGAQRGAPRQVPFDYGYYYPDMFPGCIQRYRPISPTAPPKWYSPKVTLCPPTMGPTKAALCSTQVALCESDPLAL